MSLRKRLFIDFTRCVSGGSAESPFQAGAILSLPPDDIHYLRDVLRAEKGDEIVLFDRAGLIPAHITTIESVGAGIKVRVNGPAESSIPESPVQILMFALSKGEKNDLVVQKATELGVGHIILWQAERSIVRINASSAHNRMERWLRISESAAEQSGQPAVPRISILPSLSDMLESTADASMTQRMLSCSLSSGALPMHACITDRTPLCILIGPEGGLSEAEEEALTGSGFCLVSLGSSVLRSETAAIAAVAMAQALWRSR